MNFSTLELSDTAGDRKKDAKYKYITNSDAHTLTDISQKVNFLEVEEINIQEILKKLK